MTIVLRILAGIAALVGAMACAGLTIPRRHIARRTARYARRPEEVYAAITAYEELPQWQPGVARVEILPPRAGKARYRTHGKFGAMTLVVEEAVPPRRVVGRIDEPELGFGGTWIYEIAPVDGGATLTITEDGFISNPIFRALARFVFGYHRTMEGYLRGLGRKFGEATEPRPP